MLYYFRGDKMNDLEYVCSKIDESAKPINKIYIVGEGRLGVSLIDKLINYGYVVEANSLSKAEDTSKLPIEIVELKDLLKYDTQLTIEDIIKTKPTKYTSSIGYFDKYLNKTRRK